MAPAPIQGPEGAYNVAHALLAAALPAVTDANGAPGRVGIADGSVVIADCCETGGQLWVAWHQTWPTTAFPLQQAPQAMDMKFVALGTEFEVGIIRCAPTQDENHKEPTIAEIDASAKRMYTDSYALLGSIVCLLQEWSAAGSSVRWTSLVPIEGGGCLGSVLTVQIGFPLCPVCPGEDVSVFAGVAEGEGDGGGA